MKKSILLLSALLAAPRSMPSIFSDHMVMQRDLEAPVWGWAEVGKDVTVSFGGAANSATAAACGKWMVKLPK